MTTTTVKKFTIVLCIVASQATLLFSFGYDICVLLLSTTTVMEEDLKLTEEQSLHFRNDAKWAFFMACITSGFLADFLGRRPALILSGALLFVGFLIMSLATSFGMLITGRALSLAGVGIGLPVAPLYIGEVAPRSRRGFLNTIPEFFWTSGMFLAVVTRAVVRGLSESSQWRGLLGVGAVPSLVLAVGMVFMPESPCWLMRRARVADAKAALGRTLRTEEEVNQRQAALRTAARIPETMGDENFDAVAQDIHLLAIWQEIRRPLVRFTLWKLFLSNVAPHLIQQATAVDLLTFESLTRFPPHDPYLPMEQLPFLLGRLLSIFVPLFLADIVGRRRLVWLSMVMVTISMIVMNVSVMALHHQIFDFGVAERMNKWSLVAFFGSYSLGLGPVPWLHSSEVLPFKVRAQLVGITVVMNRLISLGLVFVKPTIEGNGGWTRDVLYVILNMAMPYMGQKLCRKHLIETLGESLEVTDLLIGPTLELNLGHVAFNF